jgi:hypothetical protein
MKIDHLLRLLKEGTQHALSDEIAFPYRYQSKNIFIILTFSAALSEFV